MRINIILPFTNATGGIRVALEYANRLGGKGHDVVCYTPMLAYKFNNSGLIGKFKRIKASIANTIIRGKSIRWFPLEVKLKLVPFISNKYIRDADITIATAWPTAFDVYKLSDIKGKKFYFIQGYEIWSGPVEKVNDSYRLPMQHITISKWLKDLLQEKFASPKVDIIYSGTDIKYDISKKVYNKNKRILIMYHELESKGFEDGIKAIKVVKEKYPDLEVTVFGQRKVEIDLENVLFFEKPNRNELEKIYSEADIFVFPSREEGWGLTVIEAMSCGCAVVGTNVGCIQDIGIQNQTALISAPQDINSLANNICRLVENESMLINISNNGYQKASKLTWENATSQFEIIMRDSIRIRG